MGTERGVEPCGAEGAGAFLEGPEVAGVVGVLWEGVQGADPAGVRVGVQAGVLVGAPEAACVVWGP